MFILGFVIGTIFGVFIGCVVAVGGREQLKQFYKKL